VIIAPTPRGGDQHRRRQENLRLLLAGGLPNPRVQGLLVNWLRVACWCIARQRVVDDMLLNVVTQRSPTNAERRDLAFAFRVVKHVKSNAIVYARTAPRSASAPDR